MPNGSNGGDIRIYDGQMDFSGGVSSGKPPTIASPNYPNGVHRDQICWLTNATVRGGGITQRTGWQPRVQGVNWPGIFQGAYMYQPNFADPHIVVAIGGKLYAVRVDTDNSVEDLSALSGLTMPATEPQSYFAQAEQFLVWQCGDEVTNPIFYWRDNAGVANLRRSLGFVGVNNAANEIPAAGPMDYHMNRLWYAFGRQYAAGDIVSNKTSGTAPFNYIDSVLHVTENPVAKGGDAFSTPTSSGNIRALKHTSLLDTALGQSPLFVFTRSTVYLCDVPVTRAAWTAATLDNMPLQRVALKKGGTYAERSVVSVNDDLYYLSTPNGDVRSLQMSVRNFHSIGNIPISRDENRILRFNDRSLLRYGSGIEFDNRLWQTALPVQTPVGVAFRSILPLDFDIISTLSEKLPPAWEGSYEGLQILQMVEGDFGGLQRAFAIVYSQVSGQIEVWEFSMFDRFQNGDNRVQWAIEFPALTWNNLNQLKQLTGGEISIDKLYGTVEFILQYRPDSSSCFLDWTSWKLCSARDCTEDPDSIDCPNYPSQPYCEAYDSSTQFPAPPSICIRKDRPSDIGFQFQARLIIKGWCRIRSFMLHAQPRSRPPYSNIAC